jgi:putative PIN family toxin of toxin-antitoxin system
MRLVVDSNVWISALVFGGQPRKVFETAVRNGYTIVISPEIITEVRRTLHAKFPDFIDDFEALLAVLTLRVERVELGSARVDLCRDPDDNRVLETAVIGRATCIISGDKDLLTIDKYNSIFIRTPKDAVALFSD